MADMTKGIYRRIYSGAIRGKRINGISIQAEFWFWRVHMICDDFGSFEADPYICRVSAAPRRRTIKDSDVRKWLGELQSAGLIRLYDVDGERFGTIVEWEKWQPAGRNGRRVQKYPGESEGIPGNPENPNPSGTSHLHPHLHPHPQARGDRNPPGKSRPSWTEEDVDAIYDAYPRHVAPLK
ncbi:MAG: hypothetical protein GWO24_11425, partial [Akkermansiaceae bacterium]|nr:hypothetical protein [Akkermansiaceae bacterium]